MKIIKLSLILFLSVFFSKTALSQFDKPVFQLTVGISEPLDQLKGGDYVTYTSFYLGTNYNQQLIFIDSSFMKDDYKGKTGININGSAKINFDKFSIVRGVGFISFNSFNTFQAAQSGNTLQRFINNTYQPISVKYNYSMSIFSLGAGLEVAPTSFTNIVSPFFGANFSFNFINASLDRTFGGRTDTSRVSMSDTRIGVNLTGGIEFKINPQLGFVLGAKYDLGNLIGKNTNQSLNDAVRFGSTNASINDGNGGYYSNIYYAVDEGLGGPFQTKEKKINWLSFFVGVNFYPSALIPKK